MTETALARRNGSAALAPAGSTWTEGDIALIRSLTADKATDEEFKLLLYMAHQYQLDPLLKQIYLVKYGNKPAQIFAGRDGYLAIAQRSGALDGLSTTVRVEAVPLSVEYTYYADGARKTGTFRREVQYVATCTIWHRHMSHPVISEVWEEEYTTGRDLWVNKPRTMIAKVAECQALRKAFNISGLYDPDEIAAPAPAPTTPRGEPVNTQTGEIMGEAREVPADAPDSPRAVPTPERDALYQRLRTAGLALGLDGKAINEEVVEDCGTPVKRLPDADLERVVEKYERQAADVQGGAA